MFYFKCIANGLFNVYMSDNNILNNFINNNYELVDNDNNNIFDYHNITVLYIYRNSLPLFINDLPNLKYIEIINVAYVPYLKLFNLPNLNKVIVNNVNIEVLIFDNLPLIKFINCANNNIHTIIFNGEFNNLSYFNCNCNYINYLPLYKFPNLNNLIASNNILINVNIKSLKKLINVDLSFNKIQKVLINNNNVIKVFKISNNNLIHCDKNKLKNCYCDFSNNILFK